MSTEPLYALTHGPRSWRELGDPGGSWVNSKSLDHSGSVRKLLWLGVGSQRGSSVGSGARQRSSCVGHGEECDGRLLQGI